MRRRANGRGGNRRGRPAAGSTGSARATSELGRYLDWLERERGHRGILLEQLKNASLAWDLRPGSRLLWFTTTAWMMWNALVSALLSRGVPVMIDGNPSYPDLTEQWRLAEESRAALLGVSPGYVMASRKQGVEPTRLFDLSSVHQIGCVGSPLPLEGFSWLQDRFGPDVLVNVTSCGTDVCTAIIGGSPLQPVWAGEMSGPCLGFSAASVDDHHNRSSVSLVSSSSPR